MFAQKLDHVGGGHRRYRARVTHTAKKYELILSFYAHKDRRNACAACVVSYVLIENIFEPLNVKFKYFLKLGTLRIQDRLDETRNLVVGTSSAISYSLRMHILASRG